MRQLFSDIQMTGFMTNIFFRKTIEIEDLDDLLTAFVCDDNIDLKAIAEPIENKRLAEIILVKSNRR